MTGRMEPVSRIASVDLHWARPKGGAATGVLVLAGSSGRLDRARADRLARAGATAVALRWFGGEMQPRVAREVPIETFISALDLLARECDRLAVLGVSYGAEAALVTAVRDRRVRAVVALAPTDVTWEGDRSSDEHPRRSKWTWRGEQVPFVPLDQSRVPTADPPAYVDHYRHSRNVASPSVVEAASIPVERIEAEVVLVAGGDDQVWPSPDATERISTRRHAHGLTTTTIVDPHAGHPVVLPGEASLDLARPYRVGGDYGAPERLGQQAWPTICGALHLWT